MSMAATTTREKRPRLQFSLRSMLGLILLACLGLALLAHRARQQRRVIAEIEELGILVRSSPPPPSGQWLQSLLGDNLLGVTYSVTVSGKPTPEQLRILQRVSNLQAVRIEDDSVSNYQEVESLMDSIEGQLPQVSITISYDYGFAFRGRGCEF